MEWTKDQIKTKLQNDDGWVIRGVMAIFKYQTYAEQKIEHTQDLNGVGFNGPDSFILTSFAKQLNHKKSKNRALALSQKQMYIARKKIMKYAGQLAKIANGIN